MSDAGLTAGAVARRLGVAVTTLRTWHRRYGLGPSAHLPGQHRRYTAADVARLEAMVRLVAGGMPPAEAARWAGRPAGRRARPTPPQPGTDGSTAPAQPGTGGSAAPAQPGTSGSTAPAERGARRDGGGLPVHGAEPAARGLARAAMRLDAAATRHRIAEELARLGVVGTWDRVVRPVLTALGERHAASGELVEVEHLLSACLSAGFAAVPRPPAAHLPPVGLLACADEEQHTLALEALDAALAERGVACRMLGARVPVTALTAAVRRTGPHAVILWSQHRSTAGPEQLTALLAARPRPVVVAAAGPGWAEETLPAGVVRPASLQEAADLLLDLPVPATE